MQCYQNQKKSACLICNTVICDATGKQCTSLPRETPTHSFRFLSRFFTHAGMRFKLLLQIQQTLFSIFIRDKKKKILKLPNSDQTHKDREEMNWKSVEQLIMEDALPSLEQNPETNNWKQRKKEHKIWRWLNQTKRKWCLTSVSGHESLGLIKSFVNFQV